jgi:hypothetical protein
MAVDLDAWRREHPAWSVTLDGYTYRGRPVSARAVAAMPLGKGPVAEIDAMERLFRLAFPWRFSYLWRGDPVKRIMGLDPPAYKAVVQDFFECLGLRPSQSPRGTSTTDSPR